jgi:uncharacterized protein with PIN domain
MLIEFSLSKEQINKSIRSIKAVRFPTLIGWGASLLFMKVPITKAGQPCRHCGFPVVERVRKENRKVKVGQKYYFKSYFWCDKCRSIYMDHSKQVLI